MVLVNAPVRCTDPALRAVHMAIAMQSEIQCLISGWRERGFSIGYGIAVAMGWRWSDVSATKADMITRRSATS